MKFRHSVTLFCVCLPVCLILRALQLIFTIDEKTGFIKQQYTGISVAITLVILAGVASVGLISFAADGIKMCRKGKNPVLAAASVLVGIMFVCDTAAFISTGIIFVWYDALLIISGLLSAGVFIAFGVKKVYPYKFSDILLIIPAFYCIVRLISIFVSTSELSLVTENVFLLFTNGVLLLFMFEFSKAENNIDETPKTKKISASGITACMLCFIQSVPKIAVYGRSMSLRDITSALLTLAFGIFVLSYVVSEFSEESKSKTTHTAKHLAE